jgi:hemerythrin
MDFDHEVLHSILTRLETAIFDRDYGDLGFIHIRMLAYVDTHFETEESLMDSSGYPMAEDHKFQHRELRGRLVRLGDMVRHGENDGVAAGFLMLKDWMLFHLDSLDRALANYLRRWESSTDPAELNEMRLAVSDQLADSRRSPRYERASLVKISPRNSLSGQIAVVENVSEGGLLVSAPTRYAIGQTVTVVSARGLQDAIVRHCRVREQDACFAIGLEYAS